MKKTNILILLAISIISLILVSGTLAAASASRNAVLDATTPDGQPEDVQDMYTWDKVIYVNEVPYPWEPQIVISVQTSDTVRIVDTVTFYAPHEGFSIIEHWIPWELMYLDVSFDPAYSAVTLGDGTLEWVVFPGFPPEMVLTKWFHVEPCTWDVTILEEDFYIGGYPVESRPVAFQKLPPDLWIDADYDPEVTAGQPAYFTLNYGNSGGYENNVMIRNEFPATAPFLASIPPPDRQGPGGIWVEWDVGDLANDAVESIDVDVTIQAGLPPSTTIDIWDYIFDHVGIERYSVNIQFHVQEPPPSGDLGDAPDSTNHYLAPMTAYPGPPIIMADYPTVFDPATGLPQGPLHLVPEGTSWLGQVVSYEFEADILLDSDGPNNIDPTIDLPDQDGFDDGLIHPVLLPHCVPTQLTFEISSVTLDPMLLNVWFDWNRNGDWRDQNTCSTPNDASEWSVQNDLYTPPSTGSNIYQTTAFLPFNTSNDPIWMRVTLSEQPAPAVGGPADGRGPEQGYLFGETEDYILENTNITLYLPLILKSFSSP